MDDVVAATVAQQVNEYAEPEPQWRPQRPTSATIAIIERHSRPHRHDRDTGYARRISCVPLRQSQVCHLVTLRGEPLRETAIPPLGAPDHPGEEAIVDDADPHTGKRLRRFWLGYVRAPGEIAWGSWYYVHL